MSSDGIPSMPSMGSDGSMYGKRYALSGKIMLTAIVVLFFVVILMVCLHIYARWYLLRARRRGQRRRRGSSRGNLVFHVDGAAAAASRGLDAAVMRALPVFVIGKDSAGKDAGECAVCLSEFEDGEAGRRLPKCGHSFHTECIDMWFHSHSTCPLCRSPVEAGSEPEIRLDIAAAAAEPNGAGPVSGPDSPGLCSDCEASSSVESRRKPVVSVSIDVPRRNFESFGESGSADSPAGQTTSYRSPMSRMLSFKRILSRERRNGGVSPSGNCNATNISSNWASCSSVVNELDIERGKEGTQ